MEFVVPFYIAYCDYSDPFVKPSDFFMCSSIFICLRMVNIMENEREINCVCFRLQIPCIWGRQTFFIYVEDQDSFTGSCNFLKLYIQNPTNEPPQHIIYTSCKSCKLRCWKVAPSSYTLHCEKRFPIFPSPAGMSLTKLSLAGQKIKLFPAREGSVSDIPAGDEKTAILFYSV